MARETGYIINNYTNAKWKFEYNPESFSAGRQSNFTELTAPNIPYPVIQFANGSSMEVSISIYIRDTTGDKQSKFETFLNGLMPTLRTDYFTRPQSKIPPCYVYLAKSSLLHFNAYLSGFTVDSSHLTEDLKMIEATYKLTFKVVI